MQQEIVVTNKTQFLAAVECARHCPYDTHIRIIGVSTEFTIFGTEVVREPDRRWYPVPIGDSEYPRYSIGPWEIYARSKKAAGRNVSKLKGRVRKLEARLLKGVKNVDKVR